MISGVVFVDWLKVRIFYVSSKQSEVRFQIVDVSGNLPKLKINIATERSQYEASHVIDCCFRVFV